MKQHPPGLRTPALVAAMAVFAVLLAATSAIAHVVDLPLSTFLSRYSDTAEETITDFNTFKLIGTFITVR